MWICDRHLIPTAEIRRRKQIKRKKNIETTAAKYNGLPITVGGRNKHSLLCFKLNILQLLNNVRTQSLVKYFCSFSTDSEVVGRRCLSVNHFAILGLGSNVLTAPFDSLTIR